jgi:VIT1/CCC1 family predicted Fe2+/Mn2+ transporter
LTSTHENPQAEKLFAILAMLLSPLPDAWQDWFMRRVRMGYDVAAQMAQDSDFAQAERAQMAGGNLVSTVLGIAVAVIVAVGVSIPIVNDVIADSNLTGITATVVGFIPVMLGVLIFVATVGPIMSQ